MIELSCVLRIDYEPLYHTTEYVYLMLVKSQSDFIAILMEFSEGCANNLLLHWKISSLLQSPVIQIRVVIDVSNARHGCNRSIYSKNINISFTTLRWDI